MTLQRKIVATLLITGFCYGLVEFAVQKWIVYPSFIDIENIQAKHNVNRCIRALQRENEHLNKYCYDWAAWDECALYVQGKNTDFIQQNAVETTFMTQRFNLICFLDANDRFVWGKCVTFDDNEAIEVSVHEFSPAVLKQEHAMLGHKTPEDYFYCPI
jgi:sensor domain CHASE-containing protein